MNNAQKGDKILAYDNEQTAAINDNKDKIATVEQSVTDLDAKLSKDYIVDYGSNENGTWKKWNSGILEITLVSTFTVNIDTSYQGFYYNSQVIKLPDFPVNFMDDNISFNYDIMMTNASVFFVLVGSSTISKDSSGEYYIYRHAATTNAQGKISGKFTGRWK